MDRVMSAAAVVLAIMPLYAAPVPTEAKVLVAALGDPSAKARDQAESELRNRPDAGPWLRRAARSADRDTAARASGLLATFAKQRQTLAKPALDACIKGGLADLFVEWHHFWQPESKDELWPVGPLAGKLGLDAFAARYPVGTVTHLDTVVNATYRRLNARPRDEWQTFDGLFVRPLITVGHDTPWLIRTDCLGGRGDPDVAFASVAGPVKKSKFYGGYYFALGEINAPNQLGPSVIVADGGVTGYDASGVFTGVTRVTASFIACRGNAAMTSVQLTDSVILVEGDIDLSKSSHLHNSVIRASGDIHLPKVVRTRDGSPPNCTIEAHAKNATAPYKFFELADLGLTVIDDEEGLRIATVTPDTPFGNSGLAPGDIIIAIDDTFFGHSSVFRQQVRRAVVRQGECLLTVARGSKTSDVVVTFPLPK